ncbi:MAG: hypothetical protein K0R82_1993 [Flavipsychrobacter sp.]|jgi:hypothetical protein|nr:hypothetical protein [Flavipsychrobacter sp.]
MKLYPKKLNSLEELKREKQVLKYARKHSKPDGLMDIKIPSPTPKEDKQSDYLSFFGDLLTSRNTGDMLMTFGLPLLKLVGRKTEKSLLRTVVGEVFGGYLKFKMLQLGVRGVKLFLHKQKAKKEEHKAEKKTEQARQQRKSITIKQRRREAEYATH